MSLKDNEIKAKEQKPCDLASALKWYSSSSGIETPGDIVTILNKILDPAGYMLDLETGRETLRTLAAKIENHYILRPCWKDGSVVTAGQYMDYRGNPCKITDIKCFVELDNGNLISSSSMLDKNSTLPPSILEKLSFAKNKPGATATSILQEALGSDAVNGLLIQELVEAIELEKIRL